MKNDKLFAVDALAAIVLLAKNKKCRVGSVDYGIFIYPQKRAAIDKKIKDDRRFFQLSREWYRYYRDEIDLGEFIKIKAPELYKKWSRGI